MATDDPRDTTPDNATVQSCNNADCTNLVAAQFLGLCRDCLEREVNE